MSSTTRLLVLGVVRIFQPVHGYDVRRELVSWHAEEWANVAPGSIYNALKSLARDGLLEVEGTDQVGARPERTTYRITPRGETEMMELLRDTLWHVVTPVDPLVASLSLMAFLDRKELMSALEARTAKIKGDLEHAQHVIEAIDDIETPLHVRPMMSLLNARLGSELAWSEKFRAELAQGTYRTKGDPPWMPLGVDPKLAMKQSQHAGPAKKTAPAKAGTANAGTVNAAPPKTAKSATAKTAPAKTAMTASSATAKTANAKTASSATAKTATAKTASSATAKTATAKPAKSMTAKSATAKSRKPTR